MGASWMNNSQVKLSKWQLLRLRKSVKVGGPKTIMIYWIGLRYKT